jgi:excinuclease UvrABC nuclease subunit
MRYHLFDLALMDPEVVRDFLKLMVKEGLVGGIYLWINRENGKMYVGSSMNLCSRISGYLNFSNLHGMIGDALRKYGLNSF